MEEDTQQMIYQSQCQELVVRAWLIGINIGGNSETALQTGGKKMQESHPSKTKNEEMTELDMNETIFKALEKLTPDMRRITEEQLKAQGMILDYKNRKLVNCPQP